MPRYFSFVRVEVLVSDPLADPEEALKYYGVDLVPWEKIKGVDAVILAVMHQVYRDAGLAAITGLCSGPNALIIDIKGCFSPEEAENSGILYWRL